MAFSVVASTQSRLQYLENGSSPYRVEGKFQLIQGSFSSKKVAKKSLILAGLHKATDGALVGLLIGVSLMSGLALHSQHLWSVAFSQLKVTRALTIKLMESTAVLESYILSSTTLPSHMIRTKTNHLLYLETPSRGRQSNFDYSEKLATILSLFSRPIKQGY